MPVTAANAPVTTIEAARPLPASTAMSVAGTSITIASTAIGSVHTVELTTTSPPSATRPSTPAAWSGCMTMADHAWLTVGGASIGPSAKTSVTSVLPPRIMPP